MFNSFVLFFTESSKTPLKPREAGKKNNASPKCKGQGTNIQAENTFIENINISTTPNTPVSLHIPTEIQNLRESVREFSTGHYILIVDGPDHVNDIDALGLVKWLVILDLDADTRCTGLHSRLTKTISKLARVELLSYHDTTKCSISDQTVTWIGMNGLSEYPDSIIQGGYSKWRPMIKTCFVQLLNKIKTFSDTYTVLNVVVLWSDASLRSEHIRYMIEEISDMLTAKFTIVVHHTSEGTAKQTRLLITDNDNVTSVHLPLKETCKLFKSCCLQDRKTFARKYQLPTSDGLADPGITKSDYFWLKEDLDVLYLEGDVKDYTEDQLKREEKDFFKGGTIPWSLLYYAKSGFLDIERDLHELIVNDIKREHIAKCKSGCITLYHNPGSGGTTLGRRVLWDLRQEVPCVMIKHRFGALVSEIFEKIKMLFDKTHLPVVVLIDGEDRQRVDSIYRFLEGHLSSIIIYVQRYWTPIMKNKQNKQKNTFFLQNTLTQREAMLLNHHFSRQCENDQQRRNIKQLASNIQDGHDHSIIEFGLAVFKHKYKGIHRYVAGYLQLDGTTSLKPWQRALAYLSLVYFYGQSSLPCHFFTKVLESKTDILKISDFPEEMPLALIAEDNQHNRKNMVRVSHHLVAKDILNQILTFPLKPELDLNPDLTKHARQNLAKFAVQFIKTVSSLNKGQLSYLSSVMVQTFISRHNRTVGEYEAEASKRTRPRLSPLLEQASSQAPFTERFEILEALVEAFPAEPQFLSHLGRLYSICRPEMEDEAETYHKKALEISRSAIDLQQTDNIPYSHKQDLMHIYHMFGTSILFRVGKTIGQTCGDIIDHEEKMPSQVLPDVKQACELFSEGRKITPVGYEYSMGYLSEIHIRLMFCDFVNRHCSGGILEFMDTESTNVAEFVKECCLIIDELFLECFSVIEPEKMNNNVKQFHYWYHALFHEAAGHRMVRESDDVKTRRLEISVIKMKYAKTNAHGFLEFINDKRDLDKVAESYERNLETYESGVELDVPKRTIDLDYREWLCVIRHKLFTKNYTIEKVLQRVELWCQRVTSVHSIFYRFVLKSLLGFGDGKTQGNSKLLSEALSHKEDLLKFSKQMPKRRYPREWLGVPDKNIRRLVQGLRFFKSVVEKNESDLDIQKGTICPPNDKPSSGYIMLDLGRGNSIPVTVFFVPANTDGPLTGTNNKGVRVEFVLGFSFSHGYEAYDVKRLETETCPRCKIEVEKRSMDVSVRCPKCSRVIFCSA